MNKQDNGKTEFFCGSCWIVHKGPQPEALKDLHDYRDQLRAKKNRKKKRLWKEKNKS